VKTIADTISTASCLLSVICAIVAFISFISIPVCYVDWQSKSNTFRQPIESLRLNDGDICMWEDCTNYATTALHESINTNIYHISVSSIPNFNVDSRSIKIYKTTEEYANEVAEWYYYGGASFPDSVDHVNHRLAVDGVFCDEHTDAAKELCKNTLNSIYSQRAKNLFFIFSSVALLCILYFVMLFILAKRKKVKMANDAIDEQLS